MTKAIMLTLIGLLSMVAMSIVGCVGEENSGGGEFDTVLQVPQHKVVADYGENWEVTLDGGGWRGSELAVQVTVKNAGRERLDFGWSPTDGSAVSGNRLEAVDSTEKLFEPDSKPFYVGEYYPGESRSGTLHFSMSPYSGQTWLCMNRFTGDLHRYHLFDLGSPATEK
jgi:hypothetical protein